MHEPGHEVVAPENFNAQADRHRRHAAAVAGHRAGGARGGKAIALKVSAPFHCALMRPAAERLAPALETANIAALSFPVVANVDGQPNADPARVRELLLRQIDGPVLWVASVERMVAEGVTHALEIGPASHRGLASASPSSSPCSASTTSPRWIAFRRSSKPERRGAATGAAHEAGADRAEQW